MISEKLSRYRIDHAFELCDKRKYTEALMELGKISETTALPEIVDTKNMLMGEISYYLGRYDDSLSYLKKARECKSDNIKCIVYSYLGCVFQKKGLYEAGLRHLELGIQAGNDDDATCFVCKGDCHFQLGQYEKALEAYRLAIVYHHPNDEYTVPEIESKINRVIEKKSEEGRRNAEGEGKTHSTHITIKGNYSAPINIGGILAADDAVINRPTIPKGEIEGVGVFCPQCGCKVDAEDRFCRKCGGKLR